MKWTQVLVVVLLVTLWVANASENTVTGRGEKPRRQTIHHTAPHVARLNSGAQPWSGNSDQTKAVLSISGKNLRLQELQVGQRFTAKGQINNVPPQRKPSQPRNPRWFDMVQDEGTTGTQLKQTQIQGSGRSPSLLASFAGKNRVLVISAPHYSDGYYKLMMSLLKPDVYCELAERHMQQIVMFHQEENMGGKVRRISNEGQITEEPLDTSLIPRLMNFLKLEKGKFGMVLLRKTLQVEERYPYPVRLEAMYEVIDQAPMRKVERIRQKGFVQKCKETGVEGQVVVTGRSEGLDSHHQVDISTIRRAQRKPIHRPVLSISTRTTPRTISTTSTATTTTTTTARPTSTATTTTTTTMTTAPPSTTTTTTQPTTTTLPITNIITNIVTTESPVKAQTILHWIPDCRTTANRNHHHTSLYPTPPLNFYTKAFSDRGIDMQTNEKDYKNRNAGVPITKPKPSTKAHQPKSTNSRKELSSEYKDTQREHPTAGEPEEQKLEITRSKKDKNKQGKPDKQKKAHKREKAFKREKLENKAKPGKDKKGEGHTKEAYKATPSNQDRKGVESISQKQHPSKGSLDSFINYFEDRRRLLLITTPSEDHLMYNQQRDEYLEHVCEMAVRKLSIITIFGTLTNSTLKIDHYQLEHDKPMKGLRAEDLVDQDLITELRKGFGMTEEDNFFMVLTDFDMKVKQYYEMPIIMKNIFDYIDTFSSRIREMEQQRREGVMCKKEDAARSLENFLSSFHWRRRLFIISAQNDEEWSYQQQLQALSSQACNLGLRHLAVLKLLGVDAVDMGGVLELYPINGSSTVEREGLPASLVKDIRNYFQISPEYFSMLLVGKDGNVKSWYPSPVWSMAIIYDMVDSMQLRRQEMAIQQSLGMRCPEEEYGGYGYHNQGYYDG